MSSLALCPPGGRSVRRVQIPTIRQTKENLHLHLCMHPCLLRKVSCLFSLDRMGKVYTERVIPFCRLPTINRSKGIFPQSCTSETLFFIASKYESEFSVFGRDPFRLLLLQERESDPQGSLETLDLSCPGQIVYKYRARFVSSSKR